LGGLATHPGYAAFFKLSSTTFDHSSAQPPQEYYGADYLEGSLKALSLALYTDSKTGDPKVVMRAVMNEQVWVKRISRHGWQMFFHTQRDLERGRGKMERKLAENGQHGPKEN